MQRNKEKVAIIGGGVIGGGWAARFLLHGWDVSVFDPHPQTAHRLNEILNNARSAFPSVVDVALPAEGHVVICDSIATAVEGVSWVQESVPERLQLKQDTYQQIQQYAPQAIIGSSTSGFKPSQLQHNALDPGRILVTHPFNPVYLLPLVEVVATDNVEPSVQAHAAGIMQRIGMQPLMVRHEIDAHIADRFLEAVWREALWLIKDDIATTQEIDDAIRFGFGLRWAQMGLFETYRLAGGEEGMEHFIRQFGPALKWPWTKLMDVPELTDDLIRKIASQSDEQSGGHTIRELERIRDRNLVGFLRVLKQNRWGAGETLTRHEQVLAQDQNSPGMNIEAKPLTLLQLEVLPSWIDYNGHMTDFRYAQVFSQSCDCLLTWLGMDKAYVEAGSSFYTTQSQIQFFDEVKLGERLISTCQLLDGSAKHLHAYFELRRNQDDALVAVSEQMFLHVDRAQGRVVAAGNDLADKISGLVKAHSCLAKPETVGRYVGQRD